MTSNGKLTVRCGLIAASILGVLLLPACSNVPELRANAQVNQFQNLLPAAEKGNLEAEDDLGYLYQTGEGTPQDERQAVIWYRRAAENGYATAERHLAYMYWAGLGLPQDYAQALIWYRRAAQQGDAWAENNIGSMYATGQGVAQDYQLARLWFTRAASERNPAAQVNLGDMYLYGLGTPRDYATARQWYTLAALRGDFTAQLRLGWLYATGQGVTPDAGQAEYWFEKAANHRFANAGDFYSALKAVIDAHTQYPAAARAQGISRTTRISFTYVNGKADQAHVEQSSGSAVLDAAALRAVNDSLFPLPPLTGLQNRQFTVNVRFSLGEHP